jgi:hypothetical protein
MDKLKKPMVFYVRLSLKLFKALIRIGKLDSLMLYGLIGMLIRLLLKHTPFQLVYGQEAIFPIEIEFPSLRIILEE